MILRNGKFSGKILRKTFWKIFRTGKFSMENVPPHITRYSSSFTLSALDGVSQLFDDDDDDNNNNNNL
jgi:hypothetical protein